MKDNFGYSKFRPHQWKIISAVLSGRDQLVVMATGYGKSICFQFPALLTSGITLCVSPLISLMQDQVARLKSLGIGAEYLGSAQTAKVRASCLRQCLDHVKVNIDFRLMTYYLTPKEPPCKSLSPIH